MSACTDVREFRGVWQGERVGADTVLLVGMEPRTMATLTIDELDLTSLTAHLTTSGDEFVDSFIQPIAGAEADLLADLELADSSARVFLSFVTPADGGQDALAMIALYDDERVVLRLLRGGPDPLYAIFPLERR